MLRFLVQKLRSQSLNEVPPFQPKTDDDHDSGTESDEENAEIEEIENEMEKSVNLSREGEPEKQPIAAAADLDECGNGYDNEILKYSKSECESPSLDSALIDSALPSDCDHNFDHHSSEEELEVINSSSNARDVQYPEKRKWSQANRLSFGESSGSSDEEVRDLMCTSAPVEFCSSPPADAHKPSHSQSPPAKLFHFSSSNFTPFEVCSVSPRKKHRQTNHNSSGAQIQRPCLDFEKMQQLRTRAVTTWRPSRELSLIC